MTRETADTLWGAEAVEHALRHADSEPITDELAEEIGRRAKVLPPGAFRAWALTQPWPRFCAIVRIVSGEALREELEEMARKELGEDDR